MEVSLNFTVRGASQKAQWVKNLPAMQETQETWVNPWVRKIPWRRKWQPTPVFLPGESHGQRSLLGCYSPRGRKELDRTERQSTDYAHSCICYLTFSFSLQTLALRRRRMRKATPPAYHWNERANVSALVKRGKKGFRKPFSASQQGEF